MLRSISSMVFLLTTAFSTAQLPVMNPIQGSTSACSAPGGAVTFTASASNSPFYYSWSAYPATGVQFSNYTSSVVSVSFPQGTQTFLIYCYATNNFGNSSPVAHMINIYETPVVSFSGSQTQFCQGSSTILMASATTFAASSTLNYNWQPSTGLSSANNYSAIASPSANTTYTVNVTLGPCSNTYFVPVTVLPAPAFTPANDRGKICTGETTTVTLTGNATSYTVGGSPAPLVNSAGVFTIAPANTTTYNITGFGSNGCFTNVNFVQNVSLCIGIQELQKQAKILSAYPNPSAGSVTIISEGDRTARVFNQLGEQVSTLELKSQQGVTLNNLPEGMYFISTGTETLRVIIAK